MTPGEDRSDQDGGRGWHSFHLYYHANLDDLIVGLAGPTLGALVSAGSIDRCFFVRFALGGPHVRLRVRVADTQFEAVRHRIAVAAAEFFAARPSASPMPEADIRRINASVLATDPHEVDDGIYPDNSVRDLPFCPETDRYGGPRYLDRSLDYFTLSSMQAVRFVAAHHAAPRARQLPVIFQILFREAWGFADGVDELLSLLSYSFAAAGKALAPVVKRGDQLFEAHRDLFVRALCGALDAARPPALDIGEAARRLACAIHDVSPATRRHEIRSSHMHMTANRLGLSNPEEAYIGRLMWRAAIEYGRTALTEQLDRLAAPHPRGAETRLDDLIAMALAELALYGGQRAAAPRGDESGTTKR